MFFKIKNKLAFWYKIAKGLAIIGCGFWLLETAYFIILEGWHWKATNPAELWADYVVESCFGGVLFSLGMCLLELIEDRVKLDAEWEHLRHVTETAWEKAKLEGLKDEDLEPAFECHGCGHVFLPDVCSLRTDGYCYLCDPNITVDELLSDAPIDPKSAIVNPKSAIE